VFTKLTASVKRKTLGPTLTEYGDNEEGLLPQIKIKLAFANLFIRWLYKYSRRDLAKSFSLFVLAI
jgi:hypothetical protein